MAASDIDETPRHTLDSIREVIDDAQAALSEQDYRLVMMRLDQIRERCSWVEKMVWRRLNAPTQTEPDVRRGAVGHDTTGLLRVLLDPETL